MNKFMRELAIGAIIFNIKHKVLLFGCKQGVHTTTAAHMYLFCVCLSVIYLRFMIYMHD